MSIFFLINPRSGGTKASKIIQSLKDFASKSQTTIIVEALDFKYQNDQLANAKNFETIVIGGGDGTISNLLIKIKDHPRIGILPLGTGNDLARELGILKCFDLKKPDQIVNFYQLGKTQEIALGSLEYGDNLELKTHFLNYISFGYDAKIVADFSIWREKKIWSYLRGTWSNRFAYFIAGVLNSNYHLNRNSNVINNISKEEYPISRGRSLIFANIRSIMGMGQSNSTGSPFDDQIEALFIKNHLGYGSMLLNNSIPLLRPSFLGSSHEWIINGLETSTPIQIDGEARPEITSKNFRITSNQTINLITASRSHAYPC